MRFVVIAVIAAPESATMRDFARPTASQFGLAFNLNVFAGNGHIDSDGAQLLWVAGAFWGRKSASIPGTLYSYGP